MWPVENFEKYFMVLQYMPQIFHDLFKKPPAPPPTYLMYSPLYHNLLHLTDQLNICAAPDDSVKTADFS